MTAHTIIEARVAFGMYAKNGVKNVSDKRTIIPTIIGNKVSTF